MALLQTFDLEHVPQDFAIHIALYENVKNSAFLQQQLLDGNTDFEYAFIEASVIVSKLQVLAAAYRAVSDLVENQLKSRNVHSETVLSLSPSTKISDAFRRFGITPSTTNLLIVKVSTPTQTFTAEAVQSHLTKAIEGTQVEFTDEILECMTDLPRVRKIYKLNAATTKSGKDQGVKTDERKELEMQILGCIALRGSLNT